MLMYHYKDWDYVNYILNGNFSTTYSLYYQLILRIRDKNDEALKDKIYLMYLQQINHDEVRGMSFKEYYENRIKNAETNNMDENVKINEEERIKKKFEKYTDDMFKREV